LCKPNRDDARRAVEGSRAPIHRYDQLQDAGAQDALHGVDSIVVPVAQHARVPSERLDIHSEQQMAHDQARESPLRGQSTSTRPGGEQMFVPVGKGAGDYEQIFDTKFYGCQAKRWVLLSALGACMLVIAALLLVQQSMIFGGGGRTTYRCGADVGLPSVWTREHREWCCETIGVGCPTTLTTTTLPFNCKADFYDWRSLWSPGKKAWCCDHFGLGCPDTTTSVPYACTAGVKNWEKEWSIAKKAWCCEHQYVGCPTEAPTTSSDISTEQQPFASTTSAAYNCDDSFVNWSQKWSAHRRAWCCEFRKRGCPTLPPA